jgi:hypothetical protein
MVNRYLFKALSLMQFLIFLIFFVAGLYLFVMSQSSRSAEFGEAATVEKHAIIAIVVSLFFLGSLIGVWRRERWAWWTGLIVNVLCFAVFYWALIYKQADVEFTNILIPLLFFITSVLYLLSRPESWKSIAKGDSVLFKKAI